MSLFHGITTRDVLAVMTVAAALLFNGISLVTGKGPDAATMTLAGAVVGYYFKQDVIGGVVDDGPVAAPSIGGRDE